MKVLKKLKDGGPLSRVWGYFLIEIKSLFSIVLLHFEDGTRDAYHTHAFNAISWVLKGSLTEVVLYTKTPVVYKPSFKPIITKKNRFHNVTSEKDSWVISLRGPWVDYWYEFLPKTEGNLNEFNTLTHSRVVVSSLKEYN